MIHDPLVLLEKVAVGYGRHVVLEGLDLQLARGSFTGLLGANGSGKTTLLKTLAGILPPLAGRVLFPGREGRRPGLGYVPQRERLDPIFLFSSLEVVLMGTCGRVPPGRFYGRSEKHWARQCLALTGAADLAGALFAELSGGQKQRVLIARALATRPELMLLDEPTTGLDPAASQAVMELLRQIHAEQRLAILMVNHDLPTVRRYAEDAIWLHGSRVLQGSVDQLLSREKIEEILSLELG